VLTLGVEDVIGKELQRPQNREEGPEEVGILVPEEIDFLDYLSMGVHNDFRSQRGGKLIEQLLLMIKRGREFTIALEMLLDFRVKYLWHVCPLGEL
jgi:hypothetical protein